MRVAALYDIHGNLPALEAVLQNVREAGVDQIVVGGDTVPGPMARECLARLLDLDIPMQFIHGNCELAVLAQIAATRGTPVRYWGTTSGKPLPDPDLQNMRWTAQQLLGYEPMLASWTKILHLQIDGLGDVLFCHGTPRSETEIFTRLTSEDRLLPLFEGLNAEIIICGHTHMQFDRTVGKTRVINAGSIGDPYGEPGAYWALLGPDVQLRRTPYDFRQAAERIRKTGYPQAEEFAAHSVLQPYSENEMLELFSIAELK
jgi:predicted phosphodiesterase